MRTRGKLLSGIPAQYAHFGSLMLLGTAAGALALMSPQRANAFNLYSGTVNNQNLEINLETTVEYSTFYRVNDPSAV
jgi:hypothetical protein